MKISIQELWRNCRSQLEVNLFENNGTNIEWLPKMTPLKQYLNPFNQQQEVLQIDFPDPNDEKDIHPTMPISHELVYEERSKISQKKLKKLERLSKVLYQIDEKNNIHPTNFVQSYYQHKTLSDKAQLDARIEDTQRTSSTKIIDQKAKSAFNDWCENGFKYEYEQILYFFNQIGNLVTANKSTYFPLVTGLSKINFNTYLPFSQINTPDIWNAIQLPYQKTKGKQGRSKAKTSQFSFDFAQIPVVNSYFPSVNKNSSADSVLSKSILLLRNVLFEEQAILLEGTLTLEEPIVVGVKYERIVN